ncbi:hypothetical protein [Kitasatospora sp. NPDC048407]|uniref:hypothetical protein n=1 Tax=Kitasatospora sp. NPDC048407 TaxID=3364051 RepID=UPI00371027BD
MRSGWVQLGAWTAATGAAVALSWLGVHAVLADTVYEGPVALPLPSTVSSQPGPAVTVPPAPSATGALPPGPDGPSGSTAPHPDPDPDPSATQGPNQNPNAGPNPSPGQSRGQPSPSHNNTMTARTSPSPTGTVHSYLMPGGRVAVDLREHDAELVSATPEAGWAMQVWHGDQWIRVLFSKDDRVSQVYVTWNGYQPDVQVVPG